MYQLTQSECIKRLSDNAFIPPDLGNTDYKKYQEWLEKGNTPEPAPELPAPPVLTAAEKLEAAGLTVEELKELLGLGAN